VKPAKHKDFIVDAVLKLPKNFVTDHGRRDFCEIEINPLICLQKTVPIIGRYAFGERTKH